MKKQADTKDTILVITVGFLIISIVTGKSWPAYVAAAVGLAGILSNYLAGMIAKGWGLLAEVLGKIVPNILLSVIFFVLLFPLALLSHVFAKKDALQLRAPGTTTYRDINKTFEKKMFENPW